MNQFVSNNNMIIEESDKLKDMKKIKTQIFYLNMQKFFPQWFIAAMVFPGFEVAQLGNDGQRFNNNKRIDGNIIDMYNETINFLERNMKVKMKEMTLL